MVKKIENNDMSEVLSSKCALVDFSAADDGEGASYGKSSERSTAEISSVTDQSAFSV